MNTDPIHEPTASDERRHQIGRWWLFGLLLVTCSVPLFFPSSVPNKPTEATMDLYSALMAIPNGSSVIVQTDWTNSTRAESGGEMEALLRILMRKDCKIAYYSAADPQAPQVARDTILEINDERKAKGQRVYQQWMDYVNAGYFPNAEGANNAMAASLKNAWAGKKDVAPDGSYQDIFNSPVLKKVNAVSDVPIMIVVTASNTFNVFIERLSSKAPTLAMVTGVMGPESQVYYSSRQVKGLAIGLKGVYDLETMMEYGINEKGPDGRVAVEYPGHPPVPGFPGDKNFDKGKTYWPTLHFALTLLILAVIAGNIGMFMQRRSR